MSRTIGIYIGFRLERPSNARGLRLIKYSVYEVRYWFKTTIKSLLMLVQGKLSAT